MALLKCTKCNAEFYGENCPSCGASGLSIVRADVSSGGFGGIIFLAITIATVFFLWKACKLSEASRPAAKPIAVVHNDSYDASVSQVERWLKTNLKDPGSLEFIEWSPVQTLTNGFAVRCKYRAKNSFNGYVIENKLFILDKRGNVTGATEF